jgi:hypothetical protein
MKTGLLTLLALAAISFSLACGGDEKKPANQNPGSAGSSSAPVPTPTLGIAPTAVVSPVGAFLKPLAGTWVGIVNVVDADPYLVVITIAGESVKTEYPDFDCGGTLSTEVLEGDTLTLLEDIDVDPDARCEVEGRIRLRPEDRGLRWEWSYQDGSEGTDSVLLIRR